MKYLLDASVIIALLNNEPTNLPLTTIINNDSQFISAVNWAEVVSKLCENGADGKLLQQLAQQLNLTILPYTENIAHTAGVLRYTTRQYGLSLGDRSCLATAIHHQLQILTADKAWLALSTPTLTIHAIRS